MSRNEIDFEGLHATTAPYDAAGSVSSVVLVSGAAYVEGKAVAIEGDGKAGFGSAGAPLLGKIVKYEDDHRMTVQDGGYTRMPGVSGALPSPGDFLCVNGAGAVSVVASGNVGPARAVSVDATADVNTVMVFIG